MRFGVLVAAASALVAPVLAQDLRGVFPVRIADPAFDWSGIYGGLHAGYGSGMLTASSQHLAAGEVPLRGSVLGVTLGANWQVKRYVFGVEGDMAWSGIGGMRECLPGTGTLCVSDMGWLGAVRGRAGLAIDRSLLFVAGGVAFAGWRGTIRPVAGADTSLEAHAWGWTIGVGSEVIISDNMSLRGEYAFYRFGRHEAEMGADGANEAVELRPQVHIGRLGVNWHF
ncbi:MAG: porin family protein [Phyllobacteriaceae bacterium]|nr:porin family protein [Phyllobacteriaceae bacterium]